MERANVNRLFHAFAVLVVAGSLIFASKDSIRKGQVIKQFFAYSITQSLVENHWNGLETTVPCPDVSGKSPRRWVEEPPLFHSVAAIFEWLGFSPSAFPLLVYLFLVCCLAFWLRSFKEFENNWKDGLIVLATLPVFLRYSIQHIPDMLAASFVVLGAGYLQRKKMAQAFFVLLAGGLTKALAAFPGSILLSRIAIGKNKLNERVWTSILAGLLFLPFIAWLAWIGYLEIPNPFQVVSLVENRHSGSLSVLASLGFWARMFTWSALKGIGLVLFPFFLIGLYRFRMHPLISFWAVGTLVFWVLVRSGNFVHDYYFLYFAPAWGFLAMREVLRLKPIWRYSVITLSVALGISSVVRLNALAAPKGMARPTFCDHERASSDTGAIK